MNIRTLMLLFSVSLASLCCNGFVSDSDAIDAILQVYSGFEGNGCENAIQRILSCDLDGETNRLVRLAKEIYTDRKVLPKRMVSLIGEYGSTYDVPFLLNCSTNASVGYLATTQIFRLDGFTSNYVNSVSNCLFTGESIDAYDKSQALGYMLKTGSFSSGDPNLVAQSQQIAIDFARTDNAAIIVDDGYLITFVPSYQYSTNRLAVLRSVLSLGVNEHQIGFVTNTIHELETLLEQN